MIFRKDVENQVKFTLRERYYRDEPELYRILRRPEVMDKFVDIMHLRLNEFETMTLAKGREFGWTAAVTFIWQAISVLAKQTRANAIKQT